MDKVSILFIIALLLLPCWSERQFFHQSRNASWDEARRHCQVCYKDLVTVSYDNSLALVLGAKSQQWIGLREKFNETDVPWSAWANGDPITFQNWYPVKPPAPVEEPCTTIAAPTVDTGKTTLTTKGLPETSSSGFTETRSSGFTETASDDTLKTALTNTARPETRSSGFTETASDDTLKTALTNTARPETRSNGFTETASDDTLKTALTNTARPETRSSGFTETASDDTLKTALTNTARPETRSNGFTETASDDTLKTALTNTARPETRSNGFTETASDDTLKTALTNTARPETRSSGFTETASDDTLKTALTNTARPETRSNGFTETASDDTLKTALTNTARPETRSSGFTETASDDTLKTALTNTARPETRSNGFTETASDDTLKTALTNTARPETRSSGFTETASDDTLKTALTNTARPETRSNGFTETASDDTLKTALTNTARPETRSNGFTETASDDTLKTALTNTARPETRSNGFTETASDDTLKTALTNTARPETRSSGFTETASDDTLKTALTNTARPETRSNGFTETASDDTLKTALTNTARPETRSSGFTETASDDTLKTALTNTARPETSSFTQTYYEDTTFLMTPQYVREDCVAMHHFGPWVEEDCATELPYICYDDRFYGKASVDRSATTATLSWETPPGNINSYRVEVKGDVPLNVSVESSPYNLFNMTPGTTYEVRVFAVKCDRELNSQNISFITKPETPYNLTVENTTETSAFLRWKRPVGNLEHYCVRVGEGPCSRSDKVEAVVQGLAPGENYTVHVLSVTGDVESETANIAVFTRPSVVTGLNVSNITNHSLVLSWIHEGSAKGYHVVAMRIETKIELYDQVVTQKEVEVPDLPPGTHVRLTVWTQAYESLEGDAASIDSFIEPGPARSLVLNASVSSIKARWDPPEGSYEFFSVSVQLLNSTENATHITDILNPSLTLDRLYAAAYYQVVVTAHAGNLESSPTFSSTYTLPVMAEDLKISFQGSNGTLTWKTPQTAPTTRFLVKYRGEFWDHHGAVPLSGGQTQLTVGPLRPGTRYLFQVITVSGDMQSKPADCEDFTPGNKSEVTLSMMCSSKEQDCEKINVKEEVLVKLKEEFGKVLNGVFWDLKWKTSPLDKTAQ